MSFWTVVLILFVLLAIALWIGYSRMALAARIRGALAREVPAPARAENLAEMYFRQSPQKLEWNWAALVLGPFWYFIQGLWVHGSILLGLAFVTGGVFAPLAWLYSGLKANEDLLEFSIARRSVY